MRDAVREDEVEHLDDRVAEREEAGCQPAENRYHEGWPNGGATRRPDRALRAAFRKRTVLAGGSEMHTAIGTCVDIQSSVGHVPASSDDGEGV